MRGILGVDSNSIIFNHLSFQKQAVSPGVLMVFWKEGSLERMEMEVFPAVPYGRNALLVLSRE